MLPGARAEGNRFHRFVTLAPVHTGIPQIATAQKNHHIHALTSNPTPIHSCRLPAIALPRRRTQNAILQLRNGKTPCMGPLGGCSVPTSISPGPSRIVNALTVPLDMKSRICRRKATHTIAEMTTTKTEVINFLRYIVNQGNIIIYRSFKPTQLLPITTLKLLGPSASP